MFHGGEPTLWPLQQFIKLFDSAEAIRARGLHLNLSIQSNGYDLNPELIDLLAKHQVSIGISLDGPRAFNDSRRITHDKGGSYEKVLQNLKLLSEEKNAKIFGGVLCVANPEIPPAEFLSWVNLLPIKRIDVLWPMEFNYSNRPWSKDGFESYCKKPKYGIWFAELFRLWFEQDDPSLEIRIFMESLCIFLGSQRHADMLVNDTLDTLVVNTDGGIEYHDYLRPAGDGVTRTIYNIQSHSLDEVFKDNLFQYLHNLGSHLPSECTSCPYVRVCGGGFLPGRMARDSKFPSHRSVLCPDQYEFFKSIYELIRPHLQISSSIDRQFELGGGQPPLIHKLNTYII